MDRSTIALTEFQTAQLLSISVSGLRKWRRKGCGPQFVRLGRLIRYRVVDIELWLDGHAVARSMEQGSSRLLPENRSVFL